ncbi:MAG: hypothetical protein COA99_08290 [Moraxellaceae bacterium]|nr:MAG: hypothetical protein COA99_08290 [Moraxellaceae bacterium]
MWWPTIDLIRGFVIVVSLLMAGCSTTSIFDSLSTERERQGIETGLVAVDKLIVKGDQQRRDGKLAEASATLGRALRLAPRSPEVYVALARVKLDAGQYASAKQFAQKAMTLLPAQSHWKIDRTRSEAQWVINEVAKHQ